MDGRPAIGPIFKWHPDEDDPATNNKIVLTHVAFKGAQTGSILSSIVQLLIMRGRVRSRIFWRGNLLATGFTSLASVGAGYYMVNSSDPIKNYDRAFRIQANSAQNRCDKYSVMYSGFFAVSTLFFFGVPAFARLETWEKAAGFATFGFGVGPVCHVLTQKGPPDYDPIRLWPD